MKHNKDLDRKCPKFGKQVLIAPRKKDLPSQIIGPCNKVTENLGRSVEKTVIFCWLGIFGQIMKSYG